MIDDQQIEREVASVFTGMAPSRGPDALLDDVFLTTGRMRPRPRWLALIKEPPMRTSTRVTVGSPTFRVASIATLTLLLLLASFTAIGIGARVLSADSLEPYGPARTGPLLYSAGADIYLADPDGTDPRPIITGSTFDQVPWFSPDGTKIAFGRGSEITRALMVADADGSNVTRLLRPGYWLAEFLPGSEQMVVLKPLDDEMKMEIIDVATAETIREFDFGPVAVVDWSVLPRPPDGRELIFVGRPEDGSDELALYGVGVDGTGLRSIGAPAPGHDDEWSFLDGSISPDGSTLLYWNLKPTGATGEADQQLHLRDLETGEELPVPFDRGGLSPQFSPDGSMVLYQGWWDDGRGDQLFLVPTDGSQPRRPVGPAFLAENGQAFGFSPDGTMVFLDQTGETMLIDLASGALTELTGNGPEASGWQRLAP